MSIPSFDTSHYMNKYSTSAVREFLQPHGTIDKLYLISLVFWFSTSIFFKQAPLLRFGFFIFTILFLIINNLVKKREDREFSLYGSVIKVFFIYFLIIFFTSNREVNLPFLLPFEVSYLEFESIIILTTFLFAIFLNQLHFTLLLDYGIVGYQAFLFSLVRGFWLIGLALYLFISLGVLKEELIGLTLPWEEYLFFVFICYLGVSLLPYSYDTLHNSVIRRNLIINLRDNALGASLSLFLLDIIFQKLTFEIWDILIPLLLVSALILLIIRDQDLPIEEKLLARSIAKSKEISQKLNSLKFHTPEDFYEAKKGVELLNKQSSKLFASSNSLVIPLTKYDDLVTIEVIGNMSLRTKDSFGRFKQEIKERATLLLTIKEWNDLTKRIKLKPFSNLNLSQYYQGLSSKEEFMTELENSLKNFKEEFQTRGLIKVEENLNMIKGKYQIRTAGKKHEFNFPGIKVIDEPNSQLIKIGSIQAIDIKRNIEGREDPAKYFSIKMPFISSTELNLDGKYFVLNMPFVSALETPKGMIMKLFGFNVTEGNEHEILEDLNRMMELQTKFNNYYEFRMSNVLAHDDNPSLLLTRSKEKSGKNLLMVGSEDTVIFEDKDAFPPYNKQESSVKSQETYSVIELSENEVEIINGGTEKIDYQFKLKKLMKRVDRMTKNDFIEYMGFTSHLEFLEWLTNLPDSSPIRVVNEFIYFK